MVVTYTTPHGIHLHGPTDLGAIGALGRAARTRLVPSGFKVAVAEPDNYGGLLRRRHGSATQVPTAARTRVETVRKYMLMSLIEFGD